MAKRPNLTHLNLHCHDLAMEAYDLGDAAQFVSLADPPKRLAHVFDNLQPLKERGLLEEALVCAFRCPENGQASWPLPDLLFMLGHCDRKKLKSCGDPFPGKGPFQVYRGIAYLYRGDTVRGLSWTTSLDTACRFARSYMLHATGNRDTSAVFTATLTESIVYFYTDGIYVKEFLARPKVCKRMKIRTDEIHARAEEDELRRRPAVETQTGKLLYRDPVTRRKQMETCLRLPGTSGRPGWQAIYKQEDGGGKPGAPPRHEPIQERLQMLEDCYKPRNRSTLPKTQSSLQTKEMKGMPKK